MQFNSKIWFGFFSVFFKYPYSQYAEDSSKPPITSLALGISQQIQ